MRFPAVLAATLFFSLPAGAEPARRTSSLGWARMPGAEGCVPPRALAQAVERRLGRAVLVSASQADVAVEGRIERAGEAGGWRATITLADAAGAPLGRRELAGGAADCRALDDEIALVIALLIDPTASLAAPSPPPPMADVPSPLPATLPAFAPPPIAPA